MAWSPISLVVTQYETDSGIPYNGAVLKAYASGTTTNIPFATDSTGATQVTSIALNASGFPAVSGTVVIPHIDQSYKLRLFPTQAAADANTGAIWTVDGLTPVTNVSFANAVNAQTGNYTVLTEDRGNLIYYTGSGGVTLNLPAAANAGDGFNFLVENNSTGNVTIDPNGSEQINGATTYILAAGQSVIVICSGTFWRLFPWASLAANNNWLGTQTLSGKSMYWAKGADIASAATLVLGTDGNYFDVTGSTGPITAITVPAGMLFMLQFDSTPTLNHHATNLNLPGGANRTAVAGDRIIAFATAANQVTVLDWISGNRVLGTVTTTTSGTAKEYTGIPAWVQKITISFSGVSTNGTSLPMIQIGGASGYAATSYVGATSLLSTTSQTVTGMSTGFTLGAGWDATNAQLHGTATLTLLNPATGLWAFSSVCTDVNSAVFMSAGTRALNEALTKLQLTMVNGTDAFDTTPASGSFNISYE